MGEAESKSPVWLLCAEGGEMSDTPETDAFIASQNHSPTTHQLKNFARILERERDEAREKIKRQAERIRKLEGATNHAGGLNK